MTPEEVKNKAADRVRVMSAYRNIESMLLSDGVLSRLCASVGKSDYLGALRSARDAALSGGGGQHATDDLKPAAQAVHHAVRTQLRLPRAGESKDAFMRDVLAPLVTADTPEYQQLKRDIFGE